MGSEQGWQLDPKVVKKRRIRTVCHSCGAGDREPVEGLPSLPRQQFYGSLLLCPRIKPALRICTEAEL